MHPSQTFEPEQPEPAASEPNEHGHFSAKPIIDPAVVYSNPAPAAEPSPIRDMGGLERGSTDPVAVVKVLSTRGVEYGMMAIALWITAIAIAWAGLNLLNGAGGFDTIVVPTSALVVCLPVFGLFFLRLKRAELVKPELKTEPSRRRWSQLTQFLAYISLLINFIYFFYVLFQHAGSTSSTSIKQAFINLAVILVVAGGILAYYWHDEHRFRKH